MDMQLISYAREVIERRKAFIEELSKIAAGVHEKLSGGKEELIVKYEPNVSSEEMEKKLQEAVERDKKQKLTSVASQR